MSDLFLTDEEVAEICAPLRQPAAQYRKLAALGIRCWLHKVGRARVTVVRSSYEDWRNPPPPPAPPVERWVPPPPPPWRETPLGRWQAAQAEIRIQQEAEEAERRKEREEWLESTKPEREAAAKLQRAALVRFHANKRRVTKLQRTPAWANQASIRAIYLRAQQLTAETGIQHHVDHEIPLRGKLVSGLHVENNLQILTGSENSRKRNRYEVGGV